jgi:serine/threonine protein phosphatase PrpC
MPPEGPARAGFPVTPALRPRAQLRVDVGAATHVGKVRERNEDSYLVCRLGRYLERVSSSLPEALLPPRSEDSGLIMIVADGMGGMAAGEVASETALSTMVRLILDAPRWSLKLAGIENREAEIKELWERAREFVGAVHAAVRNRADADPSLSGMGTTLTGAYSLGADLFVTHVGDSRAYLCRDGRAQKITRDHTMAQSFVEMGVLKEDDARTHRMRHVLTQAVGGPEDQLEADLHALELAAGDRLLLCSDGLTNHVDPEEIGEVLSAAGSSQQACDRLLELALDYGGSDNITAIVAGYSAA